MRFTEYLVEAPIDAPQSWTDRNPGHQQLQRPTVQRRAEAGKAPPKADPWEEIKKAATDPTIGRELITMLGGMYQTKRRNPNVIMHEPKMITSLPPEQDKLRKYMTALFNIAKNDDEPHLAQRSQELQQARMASASKPGTNVTPGQMPSGQAQQSPAAATGPVSKQQRGVLMQQLLKTIQDTAPKLSSRQRAEASAALNATRNERRKKNARTKVPNAAPPAPGQPTAGVMATS